MSLNPDQPILEPGSQSFIDALEASDGRSIFTRPLREARAAFARLQSAPVGRPNTSIQDTTIPIAADDAIPVRIVRPRKMTEPLPVVVYFRGGGWVFGDVNTHDRLIRDIAAGARLAVVSVELGRSPEVQFPVTIEQAYAATRYVAQHGADLNLDGSRLAVAGDGAGGNTAAAVTLLAKNRRGPKIDFQVLFYPVTDACFDSASYVAFQDGPWLTREAMEWFWEAYLPDLAARRAITATPLNATIDQLTGLPAALVITAENDVLRDEGEAYARKLWDAGVRVTAIRYLGTIHDFVMLNALADSPAARSAIDQANAALRAALE